MDSQPQGEALEIEFGGVKIKGIRDDLENKEGNRILRKGGTGAELLASPPAKPKASPIKNPGRDTALERRGGNGAAVLISPPAKPKAADKNKDPNVPTPQPFAAPTAHKLAKEAIKSSAERKERGRGVEELELKKPLPRLRSTLSVRNLFSGKDILSQISEFCNELKRMAMRKERSVAEAEPKIEEEEKKGLLEEIVEEGKTVQNMNQKSNDNCLASNLASDVTW